MFWMRKMLGGVRRYSAYKRNRDWDGMLVACTTQLEAVKSTKEAGWSILVMLDTNPSRFEGPLDSASRPQCSLET